MRLLLGIGESVTYPASSRILAAVVPEHRRGLANSLVDLGARLGPAAGTMCGALLVSSLGWRGLFLITGGAGLVWLVPWLIRAPRVLVSRAGPSKHVAGPSWGQLLRRRSFWGTCGGLCGANYAWYFLLSWLPSYLVRERHFTLNSVALWGALPYLFMAVSSMAGGILADRWISRGGVPVRVRRGFLVTGLILTAAILPLRPAAPHRVGGCRPVRSVPDVRHLRLQPVFADPDAGRPRSCRTLDRTPKRMRQPGWDCEPDAHRLARHEDRRVRRGISRRQPGMPARCCQFWPPGARAGAGAVTGAETAGSQPRLIKAARTRFIARQTSDRHGVLRLLHEGDGPERQDRGATSIFSLARDIRWR